MLHIISIRFVNIFLYRYFYEGDQDGDDDEDEEEDDDDDDDRNEIDPIHSNGTLAKTGHFSCFYREQIVYCRYREYGFF